MKLIYHPSRHGNLGDDLNEWLWRELLGDDFFDGDEQELFYGIGTVISRSMISRYSTKASKNIVFGSGKADETSLVLDNTFDIQCVRGPLTAKALRLPPKLAVTDPACLVVNTSFGRQKVEKKYNVSLMPHHLSMEMLRWKHISELAGMQLIDPTGDYLNVINEIRRSKLLITEALHGAIIADAFRVPWIAFIYSHRFNQFKWKDWAESLNMKIMFEELPFVFEGKLPATVKAKNLTRFLLGRLIKNKKWQRLPYRRSTKKEIDTFVDSLCRIKKNGNPSLSNDKQLQKALNCLSSKLDTLKSQHEKR